MAKVNKSEVIRDYAKQNPKAGLTEIARALEAKGVKVTPAHVNQALKSAGMKAGTGKRGRKSLKSRPTTNPQPAHFASVGGVVNAVQAAKALIKACGGVEASIALIKEIG